MLSSPIEYHPVIGLEVHCQLATESKIFCGCRVRIPKEQSVADLLPNQNTCPICTGHPGTLPVLNKKVVEFAILAGIATQCQIRLRNVFARKNYFYPDLPKGYQISQYKEPICENGYLEIETQGGESKKVSIHRIHLEEDAGKNIHKTGYSIVNLNRAGVPLIEIVSGPDLASSFEAGAYLRKLHTLVRWLEISEANMEEGNFRCDANVSVKRSEDSKLGTRVEIKNVNSFRFVEKAIDFEVARQIALLSSGSKVVQETRGFDAGMGKTFSMRSKEEAQDYRYFPDPDLMAVNLSSHWVEAIRSNLPELPFEKAVRYSKDWGLSASDSKSLTQDKETARFFETVVDLLVTDGMPSSVAAKSTANLILSELIRLLKVQGPDGLAGLEGNAVSESPSHPFSSFPTEQNTIKISDLSFFEIIKKTHAGELSSTGAKAVLRDLWKGKAESVDQVIVRLGLKQVNDSKKLEEYVEKVILQYPKQVLEYGQGKDKLLGFFVGQAMKEMATRDKTMKENNETANPTLLQEIFKKKLQRG